MNLVAVSDITSVRQVVDLRTVSFDVPPQEILTKDSVTVAVDAVVFYKVTSQSLLFITSLYNLR